MREEAQNVEIRYRAAESKIEELMREIKDQKIKEQELEARRDYLAN